MRRRAKVRICLAALLIAPTWAGAAGTATVHAEIIDDGALTVTSSYTYTVDPSADVVHVVADMALTNTVPNQTSGGYINKTYYTGFTLPVPSEAVGVAATQDGSPIATTPDAVDATSPFSLVGIQFARKLFYDKTAAVVLTYDIAGGAPRGDGLTRINPAYMSFSAYGLADPGALTVRVVVPAGYVIDTFGSDAVQTVDELGNTVYTAADITEPDDFELFISARNDSALATESRTVGTSEFVVKSWPDDEPWRQFVDDHLDRGVPALESLIGQPWPETRPVEISEAVTSYLYGYAGWYDSDTKRVELGEDLDPQTVVHELSHAWFNNRWFPERWINEGLAQEYSGLANEQLGEAAVSPDSVDPAAAGSQPLFDWADTDVTDAAGDKETFGYNASWFVIDGIVDDIGVDGMRQVFAAIDSRDVSYVGDMPAEDIVVTGDWRRFLDLVEIGQGSTVAEDLFSTYIVTPQQQTMLDTRSAARAAYDALDTAGDQWAPPLVIRKDMTRWEFDAATSLIADATAALTERDALAATLDDIGVQMEPAIEAEYESATNDLDDAAAMLDDATAQADAVVVTRDGALEGLRDLGIRPTPTFTESYVRPDSSLDEVATQLDDIVATTAAVGAASDVVDADRGFFERVGMYGTDAVTHIEAAKAALASGHTTIARAEADEASRIIADSDDVGRTRTIIAGAAVLGALMLLVSAIVIVKWRRRRRRAVVGNVVDPDRDLDVDVTP